MQRHATWLLTLLLVAVSPAAFPQTNTRIALNVIAFDSHHQIVGDLTSQDFQVFDQGKPQRVVSFLRNDEPQARLNNVPDAPQVAPPVVILFDLLNDGLGNRGYGSKEIIQALEPLELSDSLYLYLLSSQGELKPVRGLPNPREGNPPEETPWTRHIKPLLEVAIDNASGVRVGNTLKAGNGVGTFPAIETLGAALRPFRGRKNLIWITSGVPTVYENHSRPGGGAVDRASIADRIATTLDHDGVALSSVYQGTSVDESTRLDQFADLTGGKVYHNDVEKAVREVMAASRSGYTIEYDTPQLDGKYHKIRVTCSRKGVQLQVKQGYYAK